MAISSMLIYAIIGSLLSIVVAAFYIRKMKALSYTLTVIGIVLIVIGNLVWLYGDLAAAMIYSYLGIGLLVLGTLVWIVGDFKGGAFSKSRIRSFATILLILGILLVIVGIAVWVYGDLGGGYNYIYGGFGVIVLGTLVWIIGDYFGGLKLILIFGIILVLVMSIAGIAMGVSGYGRPAPPAIISPTTSSNNSTAQSTHYTVNIGSNSSYGSYLTNGTGFTVYAYGQDVQNSGKSNCNGGCIGAWPVFYAPSIVAPSGLNSSAFSTITRSDGGKQTIYDGWPLYFYVGDGAAGQINGQGVQGFYIVSPSGQLIKSST